MAFVCHALQLAKILVYYTRDFRDSYPFGGKPPKARQALLWMTDQLTGQLQRN